MNNKHDQINLFDINSKQLYFVDKIQVLMYSNNTLEREEV